MKHQYQRPHGAGPREQTKHDAAEGLPPDWYTTVTPADAVDGTEPCSAIFRRFAAPLCSGREALQQMQLNFEVAMLGWNLALLPPHLRIQTLAETLRGFPADVRHLVKDHLAQLVERKERKFADYSWLIKDFHLKPEREGVSLCIAVLGMDAEVMIATPAAAGDEAEG